VVEVRFLVRVDISKSLTLVSVPRLPLFNDGLLRVLRRNIQAISGHPGSKEFHSAVFRKFLSSRKPFPILLYLAGAEAVIGWRSEVQA